MFIPDETIDFRRPIVRLVENMNNKRTQTHRAPNLFNLLASAGRDFYRNQGLLMAGAVAYYTLLSIVPLSILALSVLSHFLNTEELIQTLTIYLKLIIPGYAQTLTEQVRLFVENRHVIGMIGIVFMLFFSSIAFSVLENAISVIFYHHVRARRRSFIVSALMPYLYILALALGIVLVSVIIGSVETLESKQFILFGHAMRFAVSERAVVYIMGIAGELLILTSVYLVMPVIRIELRHALTGGVIATLLWEISRRIMVWYYANLSMVNVIYGSIANVVVALLGIEVAAMIVLFGAQVIAELVLRRGEGKR
jgi:YihY family inner membrane protein